MPTKTIQIHFLKVSAFPDYKISVLRIIIFLFMVLLIEGCVAPIKIPPYKSAAIDTYKNKIVKNDLHIAVMPMTDKEQQKHYFGTILTDNGMLAIFIIAKNQSTSNSYMLRDDLISIESKTRNEMYPKPKQINVADNSGDDSLRKGTAAGVTAGTLGVAVVGPVFAPLAFASLGTALAQGKHTSDIKAIEDSMFDKTLFTQTVLPGKTAEGFAYFILSDTKIDFSEQKTNLKDLLLRLKVTDETAQSTNDFEFVF
jgi:hypothetical protein